MIRMTKKSPRVISYNRRLPTDLKAASLALTGARLRLPAEDPPSVESKVPRPDFNFATSRKSRIFSSVMKYLKNKLNVINVDREVIGIRNRHQLQI